MSHSITTSDIIRLFGLQGIVLFPRDGHSDPAIETPSMRVLREVGIPHDDLFLSRMDVKNPNQDPHFSVDSFRLLGVCVRKERKPGRSWATSRTPS